MKTDIYIVTQTHINTEIGGGGKEFNTDSKINYSYFVLLVEIKLILFVR